MIPLRDSTPSGAVPYVTIFIIILNSLVFLYEMSLGPQLEQFLSAYGLTPIKVTESSRFSGGFWHNAVAPMFVSLFMHGGLLHIVGNMWFLWIFGDNIEDRLGHGKFFFFYLLCGIGATLIHVVFHPHSNIPTIGASGAISGVLGAYLVTYPHARVYTLLIIVVLIRFVEIPAFVFLLIWIGFQFVSGASEFGVAQDTAGVAYWAHIGGFFVGILLLWIMPKNPERLVRAWHENR